MAYSVQVRSRWNSGCDGGEVKGDLDMVRLRWTSGYGGGVADN